MAEHENAGRSEIADGAIGDLDDGHIGIRQLAEHVGEDDFLMGDRVGKFLSFAGLRGGSVDSDVDAFRLLGIQLQGANDERTVGLGRVAVEGIHQAATFRGRAAGYRLRRIGFAGACRGYAIRDVQLEGAGVTIGREVREWKPAGG